MFFPGQSLRPITHCITGVELTIQILKPAEKKPPKYGYGAAGGRREFGPMQP